MGSPLDIIIFAAIAAFLVLRLRNVLGKRTGQEREQNPRYDPFRPQQGEDGNQDKVIPLPDRETNRDHGFDQDDVDPGRSGEEGFAADADHSPEVGREAVGETTLTGALTQIKLADRSFDLEGFVGGAKAAFEMIIGAFAQGDAKSLRPLLSNDVYDDFTSAIDERNDAKETLDTTLVGITEAEVIEARLEGKTAFVTIKFVSDQINVTRAASGEVVDGAEDQVTSNTDIWTFARNTRSRDPNWTLVATSSPN